MTKLMTMAAMLLAVFGLVMASGCGDKKEGEAGTTPGTTNTGETGKSAKPAEAWVLKATGIPDSKTNELTAEYKLLKDYLKEELNADVQFEVVKNYDAAVEALVTGKVDIAWLGGHTTVIAEERGEVELVACRDLDLEFKSYFIANKAVLEKLGGKPVGSLKDLIGKVSEYNFTFGSQGSTSGHLMPRDFMNKAGLLPESSFKKVAYSGNHTATLDQVADGTVDIGALNYTDWDKASAEKKAAAPLLYTTQGYVDYCWVANKKLGADKIKMIREAFLKLDAEKGGAKHAELLKAVGNAKKYLAADPKWWQGIRDVRAKLIEAGVFKK